MKKIFNFITNRFFLVTAFFLSWIFFFASNDVLTQYRQNNELKTMKEKINYLETEIKSIKKQKEELLKDSSAIEKYAREYYRMKKDSEDVFVFDTIKK